MTSYNIGGYTTSDSRQAVKAHDARYRPALRDMTRTEIEAYIGRQTIVLTGARAELAGYDRPSYAKHIQTRTEKNLLTAISDARSRIEGARAALAA